jgi:membrane-bound ClpP family serine protease
MLEEGLVWEGNFVIILGMICIIVGLLVSSLSFLLWVGIVLLVVGLILNFVPIGGRRRRIF